MSRRGTDDGISARQVSGFRSASRGPAGRGRPIPAAVRASAEQFFGFDLSAVRLHDDDGVRRLGARAVACGTRIHAVPGALDLDTRAGLTLLGHELAHVIQQAGRRAGRAAAAAPAVVTDPGLELEADIAGAIWAGSVAAWSGRGRPLARLRPPGGDLIQLFPNGDDEDEPVAESRLKQALKSPYFLSAVGLIGVGVFCYFNRDKVVSMGASAAAALIPKVISPDKAADMTVQRFCDYIVSPDQGLDHAVVVASKYAGTLIPVPGAGLLTTAVGRGLILAWEGITPMQDFALQVFRKLDPTWRNQFLFGLARGIPQIVGAFGIQHLNRLGEGVDLMNTNTPW